ncbi:MAG: ROK family protein [Phycisphaerae bacterium]
MAKLSIGADLGGTFIKFGYLDAQGKPSNTFQLPTPLDQGAEGVIDQIVTGVKRLMDHHGLPVEDIAGVGIGAPGPLSISEGVIHAMPNIAGMENVPLRDEVARRTGLPAVLENDANAAAFGEFLCGAGAGTRDMVLLTLGTGVGGGIVIDGKILHGSHEIGAELGHMIIDPGGLECGCGQKGCLERYCSATFLGRIAARRVRESDTPTRLQAVLDAQKILTAKDILDAAKAGDRLAAEVWSRGAYHLAIGCVNICRIFDPEIIVLAGGMTKAGDGLLNPLKEHFQQQRWKLTEERTRIVIGTLGNDAGAVGAAGVARQAFA